MISEKMQAALNEQLNKELFAYYLYLSMSAHFETVNLSGFAAWLRAQSQEENMHAMKFFDFILHVGGNVKLQKIDAPKTSWKSPEEAFADVFEHEKSVTKSINEIVNLAIAEKDHASNNFLQWFVSEQVEEEATASKIYEKVKMIGENKNGLFLLDRELGQRANGS